MCLSFLNSRQLAELYAVLRFKGNEYMFFGKFLLVKREKTPRLQSFFSHFLYIFFPLFLLSSLISLSSFSIYSSFSSLLFFPHLFFAHSCRTEGIKLLYLYPFGSLNQTLSSKGGGAQVGWGVLGAGAFW